MTQMYGFLNDAVILECVLQMFPAMSSSHIAAAEDLSVFLACQAVVQWLNTNHFLL